LPSWPIEGTTGYGFLRFLNGLFVDSLKRPYNSRGGLNSLTTLLSGICSNADFGRKFDISNLMNRWPYRVRANKHPGSHISHEQQQVKETGKDASAEARNDDQNEIRRNAQGTPP
jgi:maltooligosyltrehalose synthase